MLVLKGQYIKMYLFTSSFIYPCQDIDYIKICIRGETRFQYAYQDLRTRVKIRL